MCDVSFNIKSFSLVRVAVNNKTHFLLFEFVAGRHFILNVYCILFTQPPDDGHRGWFHVLTTGNSTAVSLGVQIPF